MSSLDDKRKKPDKSYGRKPYVIVNSENDTYNDMMTTIPRQAMMDQRLEKKSQFDKPYLEDGNYNDMEYGYNYTIPSFSNPKFNFPPFPGPVPTDAELTVSWAWPPCISSLDSPFYCTRGAQAEWVSQATLHFMMVRDGYFPGGLLERLAIASVNTTIFLNRAGYTDLDRRRAGEIKINEPDAGWNVGDTLEAVTTCKDEDGNEIVGCREKIRIFCRENDCCTAPGYVAMTLNTDVTDDTIDDANPASVGVLNGCPPYTYGVSGTGYSINPIGGSYKPIAVVTAAAGTCGEDYSAYATVTITDMCGTIVTKKIRNTDGQWAIQWTATAVTGGYCGSYTAVEYVRALTDTTRHRFYTSNPRTCAYPTDPDTWTDEGSPAFPCGGPGGTGGCAGEHYALHPEQWEGCDCYYGGGFGFFDFGVYEIWTC